MKSLLPALLATICLLDCSPAQVQDIGLTMNAGPLGVIYGQDCGPVSCTPLTGGTVPPGQSRSLLQYSAPASFYAVAIGFPGTCLAVPGFDNVLLLSDPVVLGFGLTSAPPIVPLPCQQGLASESFTIPANAPTGIVFRVQSLGISLSGVFGFGPALEATT